MILLSKPIIWARLQSLPWLELKNKTEKPVILLLQCDMVVKNLIIKNWSTRVFSQSWFKRRVRVMSAQLCSGSLKWGLYSLWPHSATGDTPSLQVVSVLSPDANHWGLGGTSVSLQLNFLLQRGLRKGFVEWASPWWYDGWLKFQMVGLFRPWKQLAV